MHQAVMGHFDLLVKYLEINRRHHSLYGAIWQKFKGFGVITIGANIGEFTRSSIAARNDLGCSEHNFGQNIRNIGYETADVLKKFQNQMISFGAL